MTTPAPARADNTTTSAAPRRLGLAMLVIATAQLMLVLDEQAAAPLMAKGARVDLVIARGPTRISASGVALDQAEQGETISFRVSSTGKVLRARVDSVTLALVVLP